MRSWVRRSAVGVVAAAALSLSVGPAAAQDDVATARAKAKAAAARVVDAQARADKATAAYFESESRLGQLDQQLTQQEAAQSEAAATVDRLRSDLRAFVIDQYTGSTDQVLWFAMTDINAGLVQRELSSITAKQRSVQIDDFRAAVADLQTITTQLQQQRNARKQELDYAETVKQRLAAELATLVQEKQALDASLAKIEAQEAERIRLELLRQQEENRRKAEEAARARTTTTTTRPVANPVPTIGSAPPTTRRGNPTVVALKTCPVSNGASFTDTYGQPRSGGRLHVGVDLTAPIGTPVVAPVDGVVSYSRDGNGGNTFLLSGNDGNFYYGAHLSAQGPSQGAVRAGDRIGAVGMTGNASVPHLHFEIHFGGRGNPINPTPSASAVC